MNEVEVCELELLAIPFTFEPPEWWPSGRASASQPLSRGFEPRPSHTKDF